MLQPDEYGETIKVLGEPARDQWGQILGREVLREVEHCVVSPVGDQVVNGEDYTHGDISKLQVIAPAGTVLRDGDVVDIRGEEFVVVPLQSFDYSVGRRPALRRHRPKVIVTVARGEVSDGIA
nr:hypothetical protein [Corynebacterium sp. UBA5992]